MTDSERLLAENIALTIALRALLAQLDPASKAACQATLRQARETAEAALLFSRLSDEQSAHAQSALASIEQGLGQALPLASR